MNSLENKPEITLELRDKIKAEITLELKAQEISCIKNKISINNKIIEELRQENESLIRKLFKEENNFFYSEEAKAKIIGLKKLIEEL